MLGVNLRDLVPKTVIDLKNLGGKSIAIDAYNALYQFLAIIRQPDGTPLRDSAGKVTSHLSGLFYRTANIVEMGIKPVYVFDGTPPALKEVEIKRRASTKKEAQVHYKRALKEGKIEKARMYAQATSRLEDYMATDSKRLLTQMGIPWIQAPSEGEAQAAHIARKGDTDFCGSQDYDSLLFGAPNLIRNITISGRRKLPRKRVYVEVTPEIVELDQVLNKLNITHQQLIDIGILVGTDFNPDGVRGVGPKTALRLIQQHKTLEKAVSTLEHARFPVEPRRIREIFQHPRVTDDYHMTWRETNVEEVVSFLCRERDFSEDRIRKALKRMEEGSKEAKGKVTLETFFG